MTTMVGCWCSLYFKLYIQENTNLFVKNDKSVACAVNCAAYCNLI